MVAAVMHIMLDYAGVNGTPTEFDVTLNGVPSDKVRFKKADDKDVDTANPIPIPATGTEYSRWKHIYLEVYTLNDMTQIDNIKFYGDGAAGFGTGVELVVSNNVSVYPVKNSGASTGYEVSDVDNEVLAAAHTAVTSTADAFSYTEAVPLGPINTLIISEVGNIINALHECTNYLVFQMEVISTASPGTLPTKTLTFKYDEV